MIISELEFEVFEPTQRDNTIKEIDSYKKCLDKMDIVHINNKIIYHKEVKEKEFKEAKERCN